MAASPLTVDDNRWRSRLGAALACAGLGLAIRHFGAALPAPVATVGLGLGLGGAAFVLAWAAEAAEVDVASGLVLALVAFIVVLPELVIEVHFAYTQQNAYATANLGGAIRLLLTCAVAMPLVATWVTRWRRVTGPTSFPLESTHRLELGLLLIASLYGVVIAARGRITAFDAFVLAGLYLLYLRRVLRDPGEPPELFGVARGLASRPQSERRPWVTGLLVFSALVVVDVADPFAEALLRTGIQLGVDPFLLVQSIVPITTETPELVVAFVLVLHGRPTRGLAILLASPVSQWTLAIAAVAWAHVAGGGGALPLDPRERVEFVLTAATTWLAVAALANLEADRVDAWIVLLLFGGQLAFPSVTVRAGVAVVLTVLSVDLLIARRRSLRPLFGAVWGVPAARAAADP